jgi:hypothetical protein
MYIYIHIYLCTFIYIHEYIYIYRYIYTYIDIYTYTWGNPCRPGPKNHESHPKETRSHLHRGWVGRGWMSRMHWAIPTTGMLSAYVGELGALFPNLSKRNRYKSWVSSDRDMLPSGVGQTWTDVTDALVHSPTNPGVEACTHSLVYVTVSYIYYLCLCM